MQLRGDKVKILKMAAIYEYQNFIFKMKLRAYKNNIPVIGREMSRLPHFLDNWLTDGSEVASLACQPHFTPRKIQFRIFSLSCLLCETWRLQCTKL
jgi:hypothetical protein